MPVGRGEAQLERVGGLEHRHLVLLHVLAIGERQALHHRQQRDQRAVEPPGLGAHQLGGVGVALLRHDRAAGGEGVAQRDKAEPVAAPEHDLLGKARQMRAGERRRGEEFDREIAVGDGIERICRRPVEAQRRGGRLAVDRERGAGQRRGAQRQFVEPPPAIGEPAAVAPEHLDIGQQMMAEGHRLGDLEMGEARHHRRGFGLGAVDQRLLQVAHRRVEAVDRGAQPQPQIGRDLVVARARGVKPPGGRPDQLGEPRLDIQVDVFVRLAEDESCRLRSPPGFGLDRRRSPRHLPATGCSAPPASRNAPSSRRCPRPRAACRNRSRR